MLQKNQLCRLVIEDINNLGYGVGRYEGKVVFTSGTVDGDECEVRIIRVAKDYCVGRLETLLVPSPHRIPPTCTVRGCGGCAYTHVSYEHERELKHRRVEAAFRKAGVAVSVAPVLSAGEPSCYRNKAQYPVAADGERIRVGFYAAKSHRVAEAAHCPLLPPAFGALADLVREHAERHRIKPYDEESGEGLLRHIYLRCSEGEREILLTLVVTAPHYPHADELITAVREAYPAVVGILLNVNAAATNVILGEEYRTLYGRPYLYDTLCGVRLKIAPAAFYQVNRKAAELLYRKAEELAAPQPHETLLDLYCGIGSIGLSMADKVGHLFGIEIVPEAIACARENAAQNGISHATFAVGDAGRTGALLQKAGIEHPDLLILDPPRKGADAALLDTVAALGPSRIVYISCNPDTLARDTALLIERGYLPGEVTPVDLFPRTGHVECVLRFQKQ